MPVRALLEAPLTNPHLWLTLGWLDIVQSYRRTVLGPLWITFNLVFFSVAMTFVYGALFGLPTKEYAAYLVCGMIGWFWVSALLTDVGTTFMTYSTFIKGMPIDKAQLVWAAAYKQVVILVHHLIVYVALVVLGIVDLTIYTWLAIPAVISIFLISVPVTAVAAILFARYRDLSRLVNSTLMLIMMITPVFWRENMITGWRRIIIDFNPAYYLVEILRRPLLGLPPDPTALAVVASMIVVFWILGGLFYNRYQKYVIFWI